MSLDMPGHDTARLIYLGIILVALMATVSRLNRSNIGKALRNLAIWIVIFTTALVCYGFRFEMREAGYRVLSVLVPGEPVPGPTPGSAAVTKSHDGHFHLRASVEGKRIDVIVDTGASAVVLTHRDAMALGIHLRDDAFTVTTSTANGHAFAAPVVLDDITIGSIAVKNVPALVSQPGALEVSLLGNSFLERLTSFTVEGDRLILKQ